MGLTVSCFLGLGVKVSVEVKMKNCSIIHKQTICNLIMFIFIAFFVTCGANTGTSSCLFFQFGFVSFA